MCQIPQLNGPATARSQRRLEDLKAGNLRDHAIDGGKSVSLFGGAHLHDLARYILKPAHGRSMRAVLAVDDRIFAALDRRDKHR